ncbi:MAG: DUF2189 domain-containing protein [Caulobacteraceae bacterium]|nr:DUF2189 domain-containing protein [Caulobacteraceae bacterium]
MTMLQSIHMPMAAERPRVRRIHPGELDWALSEGWKDFREKRGDVVVLALIYPAVGMVAAAITLNGRLLPMFFPLAAGVSILGPAVASGFYALARRREAGLESGWRHFLDPVLGPNRGTLAVLTAGLAALFAGWLLAAWLIYASSPGLGHPGHADFLRRLFTTPEGWIMIVAGNLTGLAFAVATLALAVVSFPMAVDKQVDAITAVSTSVRAVSANPKVMASWGFRVAGLLVLGSLPAFVGLAIVLPVLGYATWHLYSRLVVR